MEPINRQAIFSDGTDIYVTPSEPVEYDQVKICLRVAKNDAQRVALVFPERNIPRWIV